MHLFDLDGTLIHSNDIWVDVDMNFLTSHNLIPTEEYAYNVGQSIMPIAAQYTKDYYQLDMSPGEIMDFWLKEGAERYNHVPLKEGALEYLNQCRAKGERMALATACVPQFCQSVLERFGLTDYFETVFFAQSLGIEKRNPQYFSLILEQLGLTAEDCTFYDDAPSNCRSARHSGLQVVGIYDDFYDGLQEEVKANSDRYITSFLELLS